jgi:MFS family permease
MWLDWLGRDGKVILVEKSVRTIPYGFLGVLYPVYLRQLGFDLLLIGIVLTVTTASSALYTLIASFVADALGRKRTLIFFALTDALAGVLLLSTTSWWAPVAAGIVGNMTVGAGEVGPYLSLEQAILPQTSDFRHRTVAFSLYNLTGYASTALGAVLVGLPQVIGHAPSDYRILFLLYLLSGLAGAILYSTVSSRAEQVSSRKETRLLSANSKPIVVKLSTLFAVDAFGGGFIGQSILSLYFLLRYNLEPTSLGLIAAGASVVTALSFLAAAKIARKIGLLKTMVFTHIPSNLILIAIPFAPIASYAVLLLLCRQSLSQMDVPARQSFVMSMVPEEDRTPAAGLTNVSRTIAQSFSPSLAGYAIESLWLGSPFIFAGGLKLAYDLSLYRAFHKVKVSEDELDPGQDESSRAQTPISS